MKHAKHGWWRGGALLVAVGLTASLILIPTHPTRGADAGSRPTPDSASDLPAGEKSFSEKAMDFAMQDYLFGEWGGLRSDLRERGIDFELLYFGANPRNMHGGIDTGNAYQGVFWGMVDLHSEPLLGYEGGMFRYGTMYLHGEDHFSDNKIGDFNKVSTLDFPNAFRLLHLWYEQKLMDNKLSIKVGQMTVDEDFIVPEFYTSMSYMSFLNQTFFYPTLAFNLWDVPLYPQGHHALPSIPYGALGARIRYDATDRIYAQAAIYDGEPDLTSTYMDWDLSDSQGALIYFETGFKFNQRETDKGLPGNIKLGGYVHTDGYYDNEDVILSFIGAAPGDETHSPNYGGYLLLDSMLWLEQGRDDPAGQGVAGFLRFTGAPGDRNLTTFGVDGGVTWRGPIPGRDWDSIGLAASYLEISDDIDDALKTVQDLVPGAPLPTEADYEGVIELNYKAQMTAWWTLHASIQRVLHPAGGTSGDIDDAWAFVLMSGLRL